MDFGFTEEQEMFRKMMREFCEKEIAPRARDMDTKMEIADEVIKKMATQGLFGMTVPEEYGGAGADTVIATIAAEEIARADVSMATAVLYLVNAGWSFDLCKHATEQLKEELLPKVAKGEAFVGIGSTEPQGGSDVAGFKSTIKGSGDKLVLNGEKAYISMVREISRFDGGYFTLALSKPELKQRGMTAVYVPLSATGISTTLYEDMGRNALSTGGFTMDDVELPGHYLLGEWNKGFYYFMEGFQVARVFVTAACLGCTAKVLEIGMDYTKQRHVFGRPLAKYEGIQFQLADDYAALEADRLLVYRAAWAVDEMYKKGFSKERSRKVSMFAALPKLRAPPNAFNTCSHVMDWLGAYGYTKECDIEMALRGVKSYSVGAEGGQNIMRIIIARELLGDEYIPYK